MNKQANLTIGCPFKTFVYSEYLSETFLNITVGLTVDKYRQVIVLSHLQENLYLWYAGWWKETFDGFYFCETCWNSFITKTITEPYHCWDDPDTFSFLKVIPVCFNCFSGAVMLPQCSLWIVPYTSKSCLIWTTSSSYRFQEPLIFLLHLDSVLLRYRELQQCLHIPDWY